MAGFDIFNSDAFSTVSMSQAVERVETVPEELGKAGLFVPNPVRSKTVAVERRDTTLSIIQTSQRGEPPKTKGKFKRSITDIRTHRICETIRITADELQFIRQMGDEEAIVAVQTELARYLSGPNGLIADVEATWENHRLGAIQSLLKDADGTNLNDYASIFGITKPTKIALDLDVSDAGVLRGLVEGSITRPFRKAAKGLRYTGLTAYCDDSFWDRLMKNPEIYATYLQHQDARELRNSTLEKEFSFAGVTWKEYFGSDDGTSVALPANDCVFVPDGPSGMFEVAWSPGETFEDVGQLGRPIYIAIVPDMERNMWVDMDVYSYPLFINKRPDLTFTATANASI